LTQKILERPRVVAKLRSLLDDSHRGLLLPFINSGWEAQLALELAVPVYGPDPALFHLGTKTGSREVFAAAGVDLAEGVAGVHSIDDIVSAIDQIHDVAGATSFIIKTDDGVSGIGNAVVAFDRGELEPADAATLIKRLQLEDATLSVADFLSEIEAKGGVVEERLSGAQFRSPSVQLRASPLGEVEILSTHDQVLGGAHGQTYLGCRFPADPAYARALVEPSLAIGGELAKRGVIGRFAVDFVATTASDADASDADSSEGDWRLCAVEINLRNGGTTHPALTLQALTDGSYEPDEARMVSKGRPKHYLATDHLHHPSFSSLTPDDLLDVIDENGLGWDDETHTGVAFHMASAIAVAGHVGVTAIGDSQRQAQWLYDAAKHALIGAAVAGDETS
jgi:hypothetical protein